MKCLGTETKSKIQNSLPSPTLNTLQSMCRAFLSKTFGRLARHCDIIASITHTYTHHTRTHTHTYTSHIHIHIHTHTHITHITHVHIHTSHMYIYTHITHVHIHKHHTHICLEFLFPMHFFKKKKVKSTGLVEKKPLLSSPQYSLQTCHLHVPAKVHLTERDLWPIEPQHCLCQCYNILHHRAEYCVYAL